MPKIEFNPRVLGAVSGALFLCLAGCAAGTGSATRIPPAQAAAVALPTHWLHPVPDANTAIRAGDLARWWHVFDDPLLVEAVDAALEANTGVRSARAAWQQARALHGVAQAGTGGSLGASASMQRSKAGQAEAASTFKAGFDASWEADLWGRLAQTVAASEADAQAAAASLGQVQVSLAAEVASAVIELRGLQARLSIARSNLIAQQDTLQISEWRLQAGLASSLDVEQARVATEQTRSQIPVLETSFQQTLNGLAVMTGQVPGAWASRWVSAPVPVPAQTLSIGIPANTLRQRPDVSAAEHKVQAAWARYAQADAARYPRLTFSGNLGLGATGLGQLFDAAAFTRSVLASVSGSLFDGGAAKAQVRAQQAAVEQAVAALQASTLTALLDVENALIALRNNRERLDRLAAAAQAATHAELLARHRYASGVIDFRTLLDTQRTLLSAQSELESARVAHSADHVRLYKALGGGWTPTVTSDNTKTEQPS
jgi:outer membrane protein, multidrug efflux system